MERKPKRMKTFLLLLILLGYLVSMVVWIDRETGLFFALFSGNINQDL